MQWLCRSPWRDREKGVTVKNSEGRPVSPFTHPLIRSFIHPSIQPLMNVFIHSFIHSTNISPPLHSSSRPSFLYPPDWFLTLPPFIPFASSRQIPFFVPMNPSAGRSMDGWMDQSFKTSFHRLRNDHPPTPSMNVDCHCGPHSFVAFPSPLHLLLPSGYSHGRHANGCIHIKTERHALTALTDGVGRRNGVASRKA